MRFALVCSLVAATAATLSLGSAVSADPTPGVETTPIPVSAKPDWSSMKFLLGTWTCSTKSSRRPSAYATTSVSAMDATGRWMVTDSTSPAVPWAHAIVSVDKLTYDADQNRWVDVYTDDQGGYDVTYSPGWHGDSMIWTDELFTPGAGIVESSPVTETKMSDTKTTSHSTFKEKSGRTNTVDSVCTKSM